MDKTATRGPSTEFLAALESVNQVAAAQALALQQLSREDRSSAEHLLSFLAAFDSHPGQQFRVNRHHHLVTRGVSDHERHAYLRFVKRLVQTGQITPADAEHVARKLEAAP